MQVELLIRLKHIMILSWLL